MLQKSVAFLFIAFILFSACTSSSNKSPNKKAKLSFKDLKGIVFREARREFKNGLAFNEIGFEQEPEWTLSFQADDSVDVYSHTMHKMVGFYLHHDHANYYNFAREWFAIKILSKDSLVFQRLEVKSLRVKNDVRSNVYMTFYSNDFIKNKLKTTIEELRKPKKRDSLYVSKKAKEANQHPLDSNYFFAARNPVVFKSNSKNASVEKRGSNDQMLIQSKSYAYIYPEYNITIHKAYKDFYFPFRAVVEINGNITVHDFPTFDDDTEKARRKLLQGILDVYIKNMLIVKPGNTLGFPHASLVTFYIKGIRD